jgi:hypothetical protein
MHHMIASYNSIIVTSYSNINPIAVVKLNIPPFALPSPEGSIYSGNMQLQLSFQ